VDLYIAGQVPEAIGDLLELTPAGFDTRAEPIPDIERPYLRLSGTSRLRLRVSIPLNTGLGTYSLRVRGRQATFGAIEVRAKSR
jgi:hypothetical protein